MVNRCDGRTTRCAGHLTSSGIVEDARRGVQREDARPGHTTENVAKRRRKKGSSVGDALPIEKADGNEEDCWERAARPPLRRQRAPAWQAAPLPAAGASQRALALRQRRPRRPEPTGDSAQRHDEYLLLPPVSPAPRRVQTIRAALSMPTAAHRGRARPPARKGRVTVTSHDTGADTDAEEDGASADDELDRLPRGELAAASRSRSDEPAGAGVGGGAASRGGASGWSSGQTRWDC